MAYSIGFGFHIYSANKVPSSLQIWFNHQGTTEVYNEGIIYQKIWHYARSGLNYM
jgi:hypothetical protein